MPLLQRVISDHTPPEWEMGEYQSQPYQLFELRSFDSEYETVAREFSRAGMTVVKMERVQNPYTLGRFILRKEQLQCREVAVNEQTAYHPLAVEDIDTALLYNLDVRRYNRAVATSGRKPVFYPEPREAKNKLASYPYDKAIIIVDILNISAYGGQTKDNEAEYYTKYVVHISC